MGRRDELRLGGQRVRIGPWRGSRKVGLVTPLGGPIAPGPALIDRACGELVRRGYREVLTGALAEDEVGSFAACGFTLRDSLHLLAHDLRGLAPVGPLPAGVVLARGSRRHRRTALQVDGRAFPPFWQLDEDGLVEALTATSDVRFRVARAGRRTMGYVVTGLTGTMGYLQRLAVDPDLEGRGVGRALVVDGLHWLAAAGAVQAVVNTQVDNVRALGLYRSVGFRLLPSGLVVLGRDLEGPPPLDRATRPAVDDLTGGHRPGQARG